MLVQAIPANADLALLAIRWQHALDPATPGVPATVVVCSATGGGRAGKIEVHGSLERLLGVQRGTRQLRQSCGRTAAAE
jgi:hypothetical protein